MFRVKRAVILAAGLGTRMLPATKSVPKELLPVVDRPLLQYAVEEAAAAGIEEVVFVIADGKEAIVDHFSRGGRVESWARTAGNAAALQAVTAPAEMARYHFVTQNAPLGIAHAVACARRHVEGEPFALVFPDDLILADRPVLAQLADAYGGEGSLLAVQSIDDAEVSQYGIIAPAGPGNPMAVTRLVEKPSLADAPSRLGVVGRYILGARIFEHIDGLTAGVRGELQITDALARQIAAGEPVAALRYDGRRFDTGRPLGYILAGVAAGLERSDLADALAGRLRGLLAGSSS